MRSFSETVSSPVLPFLDSCVERHDNLPDSCCHGASCSLAFGHLVGMLREQSHSLNLVEIEEGFHRVPALEAAVHRSEAATFVRITAQTIFREDT